MKLNYGENIIKSMKYGTLIKVVWTILPFILRTCMIYALGLEYAGLNGLFTSILSMLSLAELGFGSAIVFSMYKPIAEEDYKKLNALLAYYRRIYRIVGSVMLVAGIAIMPFVRYLIKGDYPGDLNLYILYLGFLLNSCCSYFFMGYWGSALDAYQRIDIACIIDGTVISIGYVFQIVTILLFKNYYLYLANVILMTILRNVIRGLYTKKMFPHLRCEGELALEEKKTIITKVKALFFSKVGIVASTAFDQMVISGFIGLRAVALYGNYNYITSATAGFIEIFFRAISGGIGNAMVIETPDEVYERMCRYMFVVNWILIWMTACFLCLFQPFMTIWVGPGNKLDFSFVILISVLFYLSEIRNIVTSFKSAAGIWEKDKYRPMVAGIINLIINIIVVKFWGIQGVVLSTIIATLIIDIPWETKVLFDLYYKKYLVNFSIYFFECVIIAAIVCVITVWCCNYVSVGNNYEDLLLKGIVCTIVSNTTLVLLCFRKKEFTWGVNYIKWKLKTR